MVTSLKINLESFPERFTENSRELSLTKKVNFVFGKNGTGKTTITETIKSQQTNYQVCVFNGFENVVGENKRLDAVALGTENAEIQKQIDSVDIEIVNIKKEIENPEDKSENLFTKSEQSNKKYTEQEKKIDDFFVKNASAIKQKTYEKIAIVDAGKKYDKNDFKSEVGSAKLLSDDEIKKYKETIKSEKKNDVSKITFPEITLSDYQQSTNTILQSSVSQQQIIEELKDSTDKQNFAREGLRIHKHESGEKCAFCSNEISEDRWILLDSYFNDEVKKLERSIEEEVRKINSGLQNVDSLQEINVNDFYGRFGEQIKNFNLQIKSTKGEYKTFLEKLKKALEDKKKNLFTKSNELSNPIPYGFQSVKADYEKIEDEHNEFSKNLNKEQENAKKALRFHEIKKALDTFRYDEENGKLETLKTDKERAEKTLNEKKKELETKQGEKSDLILKTKDEAKIAEEINKLLKNMGVSSFSLELINDSDENQKGQYKIKGHDGNVRHITELSKGEKNIIAFLYFILSLEKVDTEDNKPKIIVFDDPMTSNDDTMQYLMTSEIQNFYRNLATSDYFVLLTHNVHFYLNVRKFGDKFYEKYGNFHLFSDGKSTTVKVITNGNNDFKTNYEMLWKELLFLYEQDKPDLMLNGCRRICETFIKFNGISDFYKENASAKKLFDVNQHSIDDLEAEQNGKTKDDIKTMLQELFQQNNSEEHFNNYWTII